MDNETDYVLQMFDNSTELFRPSDTTARSPAAQITNRSFEYRRGNRVPGNLLLSNFVN